MYLTEDYKDIITIFNHNKVRYLIAGAFAMSKLGYSRSTYDIDIWVEKTKDNAIKIYRSLEEFGYPFSIEPDDFLADNAVIQIGVVPNRIDILTDIDGLEFSSAWKNRVIINFDDIKTQILSLEDLIVNKKASNRDKDKLDIIQLEKLAQINKK